METNVNQSKETKGEEEDEEDLQNLRTLLFDIITPLVSLGIDVAKAGLLIRKSHVHEKNRTTRAGSTSVPSLRDRQ